MDVIGEVNGFVYNEGVSGLQHPFISKFFFCLGGCLLKAVCFSGIKQKVFDSFENFLNSKLSGFIFIRLISFNEMIIRLQERQKMI